MKLQQDVVPHRRPRFAYLVLITLAFAVLALVLAPLRRAPGVSAAGELKVQYRAGDTAATSSQLKPHLKIVNTGTATVALSDLKVRYYYSKEGTAGEQFFCDYAARGCANVTGTFVAGYLEVGFTAGAGSLTSGQNSDEIQLRFSKTDSSNYTQTGDYSFDATKTAYADHTYVTLHKAGVLEWGTPPGGTATSTATRTNTTGPATATATRSATRTNTTGAATATRTNTATRTPTTGGATATATRTPTAGTVPSGDDWLHVVGNDVVDSAGKPVWLTGVNWFGYNTTERVFHGLWSANMDTLVKTTAEKGFNLIRVPISTQLIQEWKAGTFVAVNVSTYANPELTGMNSLQIFDQFLAVCKKYGVKVLLDLHSAESDNQGHIHPVWYKGTITTEMFYQGWEWITTRYKTDDTLVAMDIKNEPHGKPWVDNPYAKWDSSTDANNWKYVCETASKRILAINPNVLVLCEGVEAYPKPGFTYAATTEASYYNNWWGGNLRGVQAYPVNLGTNQDQLMYSPHDYGPSVFLQPWFAPGFTMESLTTDVWRPNWFFIHEQGIAPLLMGEWGGHMDNGVNQQWMTMLRDFMIAHKIHHTFWCLNPNSGDTGGLLGHDWATWDPDKYGLVKPSLWQTSGGKFVSLDHVVPLGGAGTTYGVSLSAYYSGGGAPPVDD